MRVAAATIVATLTLTSCGSPAAQAATASPSWRSPSPTAAAQPTAQAIDTKLTCSTPPTAGHSMVLLDQATASTAELAILDVSDPVRPQPLCRLSGANGGRFMSATTIAFWSGRQVGVADLQSGVLAAVKELRVASGVTLSPDGSSYAYRVIDSAACTSTHIDDGGADRTLFTQELVGGHGGPPYGPTDQLAFSADGMYLLDYSLFRPASGPANFLVYRKDGLLAFQSKKAAFGVWAPAATKLYFLAQSDPGRVDGDIHSWDPAAGEVTVARGLSSYFWPSMAPDGRSVAFDAYDHSVPGGAIGGVPHLWRLDLSTGTVVQVSPAISERAVFVGSGVVWSDEEQRCDCGPGGSSAPTGKVLSHDIVSGKESLVELTPSAQVSPINRVVSVWTP